MMSTAVEAMIDKDGTVRLLEPVPLAGPRRALVIILEEEPAVLPNETASGGRLEPSRGGCGVVVPSSGEIVLVPFPFSDVSGRQFVLAQQSLRRPACGSSDDSRFHQWTVGGFKFHPAWQIVYG